ncbi:MAG: ZIP family metal transporter [Desulfobacterota bacterium]|nr:ZIP family metal transporter [Thermodesulfobacteriota bacterium]
MIWEGGLFSLGAGLATGLGALPVLFTKNASPKLLDTLLGLSAGIMLGATSFSLVLPSIQLGDVWVAALGILLGGAFLALSNRLVPHLHTFSGREGPSLSLSRVWLFVLAITIHNFPEGVSVGVGFGRGDLLEGMGLAMGIGFQNIPEGMAVAFALLREGYSPFRAIGYATLTGLVEPIGGLIGVTVVTLAQSLLPWGLAFAGGAMLFVISNEIIPETHRSGHPLEATSGVLLGFVVMTIFDNLFG